MTLLNSTLISLAFHFLKLVNHLFQIQEPTFSVKILAFMLSSNLFNVRIRSITLLTYRLHTSVAFLYQTKLKLTFKPLYHKITFLQI